MRIRPLTREDLPQVKTITSRAFENDGFFAWLNPNQKKYPNDLRRSQSIRFRTRIVDQGQHGFVAVTDESDPGWKGEAEVVGFAFFVQCGKNEEAKNWRADTLFNKFERKLLGWELWYEMKFLNRSHDPERTAEYMRLAPWNYFESIDPRWHVAFLGVSPDHQRRGVGSLLIQHGQKLAADDRVPLSLESSVVGRRLYTKNGFKIVDHINITEDYTGMIMLWEPTGLEGTWLDSIEGDKAKLKS